MSSKYFLWMQLGTRTPSYLSMSSFQSIDFLSTSVRPLVCFHGKVCLIQVQIMALQLYLCKSSPGSNPIDIGKNFCSAQLYSDFVSFASAQNLISTILVNGPVEVTSFLSFFFIITGRQTNMRVTLWERITASPMRFLRISDFEWVTVMITYVA